jgi:HEAT repeat protein
MWRKSFDSALGAARLALGAVLLALLAASPAVAQISAKQIQERYERNTKGTNIDDFVRKMNSKDIDDRLQGITSLGESRDQKAIEYLLEALGDEDMRIKAKAIDALGNMRATEATPVLIQQLFLRGTEPSYKRRILASLGKIGDPRSAKSIVEFLQRDLDDPTRGTAIYALGDIGSPEAIAELDRIAAGSENPTLQRLAREATVKVKYHQAMLQTEAKQPLDTFLKPDEPTAPQ